MGEGGENSKGHVLVLGSGLVCPPLVSYLTSYGFTLTLASRTVSKAQAIIASLPPASQSLVNAVPHDIETESAGFPVLDQLMSQCDLCVSLLPAIHHVKAAKIALQRKKHFFTTSYVSPEMKELDARVKEAGLCFLNEAGLDPGQLDKQTNRHLIHTDTGNTTDTDIRCIIYIYYIYSIQHTLHTTPAPHSSYLHCVLFVYVSLCVSCVFVFRLGSYECSIFY